MAHKIHKNSLKNLEKGKGFSTETARIFGKKGGENSNKKKKELKAFKEYLEAALSVEVKNKKGDKATLKEISMIELAKKCAKGDLKSIELSMRTLGELVDKSEIEFTNRMTIEEWKSFIKDARGE